MTNEHWPFIESKYTRCHASKQNSRRNILAFATYLQPIFIVQKWVFNSFGLCGIGFLLLPRLFYFQWFKSRRYFVAYRMMIFAYCLVWTVVVRLFYNKHYPHSLAIAFMSNWVQWLQTVELAALLLVSIYGLACKSSSSAHSTKAAEAECESHGELASMLIWTTI